MSRHETFPPYSSEEWTGSLPVPPNRAILTRMTPSALIRHRLQLGDEANYFSMVGRHQLDRDAALAEDNNIRWQLDEADSELIAVARRDRLHGLQLSSWDDPRREEFEDAIRWRLDLPTFIARHAGQTATGFRRVDDAPVCPCPLPEDLETDSWLFVDPVTQTWCCTNCGEGDIFSYAMKVLDLQHIALYNHLAEEAGMPPIPLGWSHDAP